MNGRRMIIVLGSAVAVWALLFLILPGNFSFDYDQNAYLGGAAALRAGHGYRFEQYIDLPRIGMYPPGYSAWLAAFWKYGQPFAVNSYRLEVANWIAAGCTLLGLAACLVISEMPTLAASAVVVAIGTSAVFTQAMTLLRADVLFVGGSCLLALLVAAYEPDPKNSLWWFAAGLLTALLYLVKTAALAYIVALATFGLLTGDLRRPFRMICFALPICPVTAMWFFFTRHVPTYATVSSVRIAELGGLTGYFLYVAKQAILYCSGRWLVEAMLSFPDGASTSNAPWLARISFPAELLALSMGLALFAVPIFLGIRKGWSHPREQITLFVLGSSSSLFVLFPFYQGARYGIALIPFLPNWLWRGLRSRAAQAAFVTVLVVNIPANARISYKIMRNYERESTTNLEALRQAASWINATAGTSAVVAAGRDVPLTQLFEYLGRRVLAKPCGETEYVDVNPSEQGNQCADYAIVDSSLWPVKNEYRIQRVFGKWAVASVLRSTIMSHCVSSPSSRRAKPSSMPTSLN
jgi:hypothetical protein